MRAAPSFHQPWRGVTWLSLDPETEGVFHSFIIYCSLPICSPNNPDELAHPVGYGWSAECCFDFHRGATEAQVLGAGTAQMGSLVYLGLITVSLRWAGVRSKRIMSFIGKELDSKCHFFLVFRFSLSSCLRWQVGVCACARTGAGHSQSHGL